jgi:hypothetical protein
MTRDELIVAVETFAHRTYGTLIDTFILLAEARIARSCRAAEMVVFGSIDTAMPELYPNAWPLPVDFLQMRDVVVPTAVGRVSARAIGRREIAEFTQGGGTAAVYSIYDGAIEIRPGPTGALVNVIYYGRLPALVLPADTNELINRYPELYLAATLAEVFRWEQDSEEQTKALQLFVAEVESVNAAAATAQKGPGAGTFSGYNYAGRGAQRWA